MQNCAIFAENERKCPVFLYFFDYLNHGFVYRGVLAALFCLLLPAPAGADSVAVLLYGWLFFSMSR
ncbi:hypothetical protein BHC43_09380 [Snodgrassella alvi]|nr:hypothetical protein BHC43_09380 [Snodgrassella alvi]